MSTVQLSPSRRLQELVHQYIASNPNIPQRQVTHALSKVVQEFGLADNAVSCCITEQKQCGLLVGVKPLLGGPLKYSVAKPFDNQLLRDLNKWYREYGTTYGFLEQKVPTHGAEMKPPYPEGDDHALIELTDLMVKYGPVFICALIPAAVSNIEEVEA